MTIGFLFWLLFILSVIFGWWAFRPGTPGTPYGPIGSNMLLLVMLFLLGWKVFGFVIQG